MTKRGPPLKGGNHKGSDRSKRTRNPGYKAGDNWLICDVCGCTVYSSDAMQRWDGMVTCKQDWEPRHEQDFVRARKDRIAAQGLLRPEGEDDYATIPGISGPDPLPPDISYMRFIHDFSTQRMGPFKVVSRDPSTVLDYKAERLPIGQNVESLTGYAWNGNGKYTDVGVGIGVECIRPSRTVISAASSEAFPGGSDFTVECCGMIVFYLEEPLLASKWRRVFSFESDTLTSLAAVTVFTGSSDNSLTFAAKTDDTSGGAGNGWFHAQYNNLPFDVGDKVDCRFKFSFADGLQMWFPQLDGKVHDPIEIPPNVPTDPLNHIVVAGTSVSEYINNITTCYLRFYTTPECTEEQILSWPTWEEPLPIIDKQPSPQTVNVNEDAIFSVTAKHPYATYQWLMSDAPVGTDSNELTIAVDTPGTYDIQCAISNRGGDSVTTDVVTLEVQ